MGARWESRTAPIAIITMSTDLTFLTNEPGKALRDRFHTLLGDHTRCFDCLVGYFYVSGFFRLYPSLQKTEKIRILVGLATDRPVYALLQEAKHQGELSLLSHADAKRQIPKTVLDEMQRTEDSAEVEQGVLRFLEWVRSGKLEIRAYPSHNLHAKLYIMTFVDGAIDVGRVITGSSNLTQAGLQENIEFNVELKNRADYDFAIDKFNELWAHGVDVADTYVDTVTRRSPYAQFSPYELYLKFLYEYFRGEMNRPEEIEDLYLPTGFKKLKYQEEAVLSAKRVLEEYGGVFLADVVGLGKTYMSAMLARELPGRSLVIAPPALLDKNNPGSWPNVFSDFRAPQTEFQSLGKLDELLRRDITKFSNVFIDESHRFRTETNLTYEKLAQICRGKRIILVSATPLNNRPRDILSQVKLFQPAKNSTIPNVRDLEGFFGGLEKRLKGLDRQTDRDEYFTVVKDNARETRERVLKHLMIRRTRGEIDKYYGEDMRAQGLKFPEVLDPEPLFYYFGPVENQVFNETLAKVVGEFTYARYKPLLYYEGKMPDIEKQGQVNLAKFMKILLVKRLESSFHAFRLTLDRFIRSHERVIEEFKRGSVYLSKKHINKVFEYLEAGDADAVQELMDAQLVERLDAADFRPDFLADLEHDLEALHYVRDLWKRVKRDPKWTEFHKILAEAAELQEQKLIIFSESRETVEYLAGRIREHVEPRTVVFSGHADETARQDIIANFDARAYHPHDNYRILVTTDVLAEGVNLHRSRIVINYDIPWNPTRLMQRVGRVNRIDTAFDSIRTLNFFPTEESDDAIKLRGAAEAKIHGFIEMLGADARLLTEGEDIKSHEIFGRLNSRKTITGEDEEEDSELRYLTEIRQVRDQHPDLFERIKRLPKKARSTRRVNGQADVPVGERPALLTYFRQGNLDKFYVCDPAGAPAELDFLATAAILRPPDQEEDRSQIPREFYGLLNKNKQAFADATSYEQEDAGGRGRAGTNENYVLKRLKTREIRQCQAYTEDDEEFIRQIVALVEDGALPRPTTRKLAQALKKEIEPLKVLTHLRRNIPIEFLRSGFAHRQSSAGALREVILSSILISTNGQHADTEAAEWARLSLASAFRGMEDEDFSDYDRVPLKEKY